METETEYFGITKNKVCKQFNLDYKCVYKCNLDPVEFIDNQLIQYALNHLWK